MKTITTSVKHLWDLFMRFQVQFWITLALGLGAAGVGLALHNVNDVQDSRLQACYDTNDRHDHTIAKIVVLRAEEFEKAKSATQRKAIEHGYESSIQLIDAMLPVRDCPYFVETGKTR